ncbi:substrate-binding domain-containing protein [Burkholderia pseudomallei]|uniref:substrate-binding domain-containing protein n=1 Tax=Burkholderia pseudomallei TaxID=28450 RepID=UPI00050E7D41|nr:substrate-binding domain-containing protein [Burkholderia pseudomallei]KAA8765977.1 LacI family DNA-binding transcriptional regulator [Burkholderia pseudomallei]KGC70766.1 bacterial regulatory s, lacI family protein [Burkholderia pseudomallei]KGU91831.1 bacterial regulatory s, lacI family protein [Burkholderia pseudomallei MSHR4032]KGW37081.1 bacterial regulatory s, lacI family protein [Burkholderia pseudomallei MSHR733]KGW39375.1 bacterial regulatory s, lacI family protein [Burkholderia ps
MKVNLKALSEALGLSRTTVSRALNGYDDVSEATRERVMQAAREFGYVADPTARRLATGRADAVGIVYPFGAGDLGDPRFAEVVAGVTERLGESGLDFFIVSARPNAELDTYRRLVDGRLVDGLIVARTLVDDPRLRFLQEREFPFVAYGRTASAKPYTWFDFDNEAGMHAAAQRLIAFGHRRIALVCAPRTLNFAAQRRAGFERALREAGIEPDAALIVECAFTRDGGYGAAQTLLALERAPSAIVVDNNIAGAGVFRAIVERGRRFVRDVSLIVYDGVSPDVSFPHHASAVLQPTGHASGRAIAELMLGAIANPGDAAHRLVSPVIEPGDTDGPFSG